MDSASSIRQPHFQVVVGFHTDVGKVRKKNEDALVETAVPLGYLIAVADGMGGHDCGEKASAMSIESIIDVMRGATTDPRNSLVASLNRANDVVFREADRIGRTMGATCVAALISSGTLYVAHAGDARAYLLRASVLYPLTRDHSFVQEIADAKGPSVAGSLPHSFGHIVSRSIGTHPTVNVCDREPVSLSAGDVILLCSDGLTNMVDDPRIHSTLAGTTPREAARRLVDMANDAGGQDNTTVIVARIEAEVSMAESLHIGIRDLRSMFVKAKDGKMHPIVGGMVDPTTWSVTAVVIDLRNVEKEMLCTLATSEMGPVLFGKQTIDIPQTTEALMEMAQDGYWNSDVKSSRPSSKESVVRDTAPTH